jgi:AmiR/NasT family two-component response regulator
VGQKHQNAAIIVGISNPHPNPYLKHDEKLLKLGYQLRYCNCTDGTCDDRPDICILSLDNLQVPSAAVINNLESNEIPFIVSLNDNSPVESLAGHLQKVVGFLFGEPSLHQLALEIEVGLQLHRERAVHSRRVERVSTKIQNNRDIGVATGLLMAQSHLSALEVFAVMKMFSRNGRIRITAVAKEIIKLYELNHPDLSNEIKIEDLHSWMSEQLQSFAVSETEKQNRNLLESS